MTLIVASASSKVYAETLTPVVEPLPAQGLTPNTPTALKDESNSAPSAADLRLDRPEVSSESNTTVSKSEFGTVPNPLAPDAMAQAPTEPLLENPVPENPAPSTPDPSTSESAGTAPTLRTEPTSDDELPFQPNKRLLQGTKRYSPGITYLTPSAYGKSLGQISVGGSFQSRVRFGTESDASFGAGFGLGDPFKAIGFDVSINIADATNFERGSIGFKVHRRLPDQLALAVGVDNAIRWGPVGAGAGAYGVVTKGFQLRENPTAPFSQLYVSAGAGTGRFRSEDDVLNDRNSVGVFGSVAVRLIQQMNFITEWSGQDLTLAVSVLPFPKVPIVITPAVTDVIGTAGDGPRFSLAVGLGFTF